MSRPSRGPHLALVCKKGWARSIYYIRWSENGRTYEKSTNCGVDDLGGAEGAFEAWLEARRRTHDAGPRVASQVSICEILNDYAAEHGPYVASPASLAYAIEPLLAFFAEDTVATLTVGRVKQYWKWRGKHSVQTIKDKASKKIIEKRVVERGATDGTIIRELAGTLRPALQHAIQQKRLAPGEYYVPVPSEPPGRDYWITRKEAARLLRATRRDKRARLHLPLFAMIALYTGQRRGAILDLTWRQVDFKYGLINFNAPGRRQTKKKRPIIPVPRALLAALRRAHARSSTEFVISYLGEKVADVKTGFNSAAERAGIPDCTSHTLRHTAGTWMAQRGVPLREIAGYLGHSETRTTELYAHHHPDYLKNARRAFE